MLIQLKYSLADIWRKKLYFISFLIQITIVILLITECFSLLHKKEDSFHHLADTFDISNVYYVSLGAKENYVGGAYEENIMKDLYTYISKNDKYIIFSNIKDHMEIKDIPENSLSVEIEQGPDKFQAYKTQSVSYRFINVFNLALAKGNFFDSNWAYARDESIPVVLGYSYQKVLDIGDEFTDTDNRKYRVVGFLQDGETFVDISFGEGVIGLNDVILIPIDVTTVAGMYINGNCSYDSYFQQSTIIVNNKNDIRELRNITEKSKLHYYDFKSVERVASYMEKSTQESVGVFLFISILVIIFAASLVVINTLEFVRKNIREFSIHIFCGATKIHIALRIFLQVFIVLLLSFMISLIVHSQTFIVFGVSGVILFLCLATCLPGLITLFHFQISDILRRRE